MGHFHAISAILVLFVILGVHGSSGYSFLRDPSILGVYDTVATYSMDMDSNGIVNSWNSSFGTSGPTFFVDSGTFPNGGPTFSADPLPKYNHFSSGNGFSTISPISVTAVMAVIQLPGPDGVRYIFGFPDLGHDEKTGKPNPDCSIRQTSGSGLTTNDFAYNGIQYLNGNQGDSAVDIVDLSAMMFYSERSQKDTTSVMTISSSFNERWFEGDLFGFVVFRSAPSLEIRQQVEGWMAWHYGIQSFLPKGHPYFAKPPPPDSALIPAAPVPPSSFFDDPSILGVYDCQDSSTISEGNDGLMTAWRSVKSDGPTFESYFSSGPLYVPGMNNDSFVWLSTNAGMRTSLTQSVRAVLAVATTAQDTRGKFRYLLNFPAINNGDFAIRQFPSESAWNSGDFGFTGVQWFDGGTSSSTALYAKPKPFMVYAETGKTVDSFVTLSSDIYERFWEGKIFGFILFKDVPSELLRQKMEGWLAWRYGTQGSLPSSHPYAPPSDVPTPDPTSTPSPTPTFTPTPSPTPTSTPSPTPTFTPTSTPSSTPTPSPTPSPSRTPSPSATPSPAPTSTPSPTRTPSPSASPTPLPALTLTPSPAPVPLPTLSTWSSVKISFPVFSDPNLITLSISGNFEFSLRYTCSLINQSNAAQVVRSKSVVRSKKSKLLCGGWSKEILQSGSVWKLEIRDVTQNLSVAYTGSGGDILLRFPNVLSVE